MERYTTESGRMIDFEEIAPDIITNEFKEWLYRNGYFRVPASVKYHGSHSGGLYEHSKEVYKILKEYGEKKIVKWDRPESPFVIGMLHDLCKMDQYIYNEELERWEYDTLNKNNRWNNGHAEKSLALILGHLRLTQQEVMCIRWHMGAFDDKEHWKFFKSVEPDNAVMYTHTADMVAAQRGS
ncbi:MAG: hypothetical protein R3Y58_07345 [Eubacteriales bacterium]